MLVIDEVHNLRDLKDSKRTTRNIKELAKYSKNMKLLLLTATPMFNSPKEIIWLLNFMNLNDNRYTLKNSDIFDVNGELTESGKDILVEKATGYISYIRSENPFLFPYRMFPRHFEDNVKTKSLDDIKSLRVLLDNDWEYPKKQINDAIIKEPIKYLDLAMVRMGENSTKFIKRMKIL